MTFQEFIKNAMGDQRQTYDYQSRLAGSVTGTDSQSQLINIGKS